MPIAHSIIDANSLADFISLNWDLSKPIHCELLTRGMNDVYLVLDGNSTKWALRVWRANFRSEKDVNFETNFLDFLHSNSINVSPAIISKDGNFCKALSSIEGKRFCSIFKWVNGFSFGEKPKAEISFLVGQQLANMHNIAENFVPNEVRDNNVSKKIKTEIPALLKMCRFRPDDLKWYPRAFEILDSTIDKISTSNVRIGFTHGDFHVFNAFIEDGKTVLMDFDNCGKDFFIADINSFIWANHYIGNIKEEINESFLEGYTSIRSLNDEELRVMPIFYAAKEFRFLCGFAQNVNSVGHSPLLNPDLDWFYKRTKNNFQKAGLI